MSTIKGTAEILDIEDERAKRRAVLLPYSDFETAGAHLKAVRVATELDLSDICARIHLKIEHLEAIESSDAAALPSRPYAIGFVKTYAEFLGLDAGPIVARFKEDMGYSAAEAIETKSSAATANTGLEENRDMSLWAVMAIVVFILWCAFQITRPREADPVMSPTGIPRISEPSAGAAIMETDVAAVPRVAQPGAQEIIEAQIQERIEPVYPRRCESGAQSSETVEVTFNIGSDGRVAGERVVTSSNPCFDSVALNAIKRWRFSPRTVDGAPRPAYDQRYRFRFDRPL